MVQLTAREWQMQVFACQCPTSYHQHSCYQSHCGMAHNRKNVAVGPREISIQFDEHCRFTDIDYRLICCFEKQISKGFSKYVCIQVVSFSRRLGADLQLTTGQESWFAAHYRTAHHRNLCLMISRYLKNLQSTFQVPTSSLYRPCRDHTSAQCSCHEDSIRRLKQVIP